MREEVEDVCETSFPLLPSRDISDGGLAVADLGAAGRPFTEAEACDLTGEKEDCAELGRSGNCLAAAWAALRWATIASRIDCRPGPAPGLAPGLEVVLAVLETDEAKELALGFRESFSSWPLDLASRLFIMLPIVSLFPET